IFFKFTRLFPQTKTHINPKQNPRSPVFSNNPDTLKPVLVFYSLGMIGVLISGTKLFNYNRIIYYVIFLSLIIVQSIILLDGYLFNLTYLQNTKEYAILGGAVTSYLFVIILLFKPNIFRSDLT
ncbi:MAG: hypothetical protein KMY52_08525, partial [Methanobacterium sp.]|nr:hypothetical protein [Methanobacterium sp.]